MCISNCINHIISEFNAYFLWQPIIFSARPAYRQRVPILSESPLVVSLGWTSPWKCGYCIINLCCSRSTTVDGTSGWVHHLHCIVQKSQKQRYEKQLKSDSLWAHVILCQVVPVLDTFEEPHRPELASDTLRTATSFANSKTFKFWSKAKCIWRFSYLKSFVKLCCHLNRRAFVHGLQLQLDQACKVRTRQRTSCSGKRAMRTSDLWTAE